MANDPFVPDEIVLEAIGNGRAMHLIHYHVVQRFGYQVEQIYLSHKMVKMKRRGLVTLVDGKWYCTSGDVPESVKATPEEVLKHVTDSPRRSWTIKSFLEKGRPQVTQKSLIKALRALEASGHVVRCHFRPGISVPPAWKLAEVQPVVAVEKKAAPAKKPAAKKPTKEVFDDERVNESRIFSAVGEGGTLHHIQTRLQEWGLSISRETLDVKLFAMEMSGMLTHKDGIGKSPYVFWFRNPEHELNAKVKKAEW